MDKPKEQKVTTVAGPTEAKIRQAWAWMRLELGLGKYGLFRVGFRAGYRAAVLKIETNQTP